MTGTDTRTFVRHALIFLALVALALLLWRVAYALLLAFGGVLFAVFLRGLAGTLRHRTGIGMRWALAIVSVLLIALIAGAAAFLGPAIAGQLGELTDAITQGVSRVRDYLEARGWGQQVIAQLSQGAPDGGQMLGTVGKAFVGFADVLLALVLVLFAGLYFALSPGVYTEGLVRLLPKTRQARMREVLATTGNALWYWLLGQLVVMVGVGVLTALGLLLVGVPLALPLGLIAGLLEFIPFIGPIVAAVPVLLVALAAGPETALYAALVFLLVQQIESNVLTPLVARRSVSLPPVLILVGTIALALLFGIVGAIFAAPLLVVAIVWVKMLYMEDVLAERTEVPGEQAGTAK